MRIYLIIYIISLISIETSGQHIRGSVSGLDDSNNKQALLGANVYWQGTTTGTTTEESGKFVLDLPESFPANLIVSFVGFMNDTLKLKKAPSELLRFNLNPSINLKEFEISEREQTTNISTMSPLLIEKLGSGELAKAACCNLSESFETNASVDVVATDAVSGAKKVQMLGLDGKYTQIQFENLPLIRGLSSAYGLGFIPGTWVESIYINKGAGSVTNGYESITGQLNLELLKPDEAEKFYFNLYGNHLGRFEVNFHSAQKVNKKWSGILLFHFNDLSFKHDNNKDGFLDSPIKRQYNLMNRWKYRGERMIAQFGFRALFENLTAGQLEFNPTADRGTTNAYGVVVNTSQVEVFGKTGFLFPDKKHKSIGLMISGRYHEQDAFFGFKKYSGVQKRLYTNAIYQTRIVNNDHKLKLGASFLLDDYIESYIDSAFSRTEAVPGVFAEYVLEKGRFSGILGVRGDYHNLYGFQMNPRMHLKFDFLPLSSIRFSGGRGFRTANIFVENQSILASSRVVKVKESLQPEKAWNVGVSITHKFRLGEKEASIHGEFFRTEFENQVVVDLENPDQVQFYNLDGLSYSNSAQIDLWIEAIERFDVRVSYKWYEVKTTFNGDLTSKPLIPSHRALLNLAYETKNERWKFDVTTQWFGLSRIPNTFSNPEAYRLPVKSDHYFKLNAQITFSIKQWEIYLGGENLLGYSQLNPILAPQDPFGEYFDASMIWGPVIGRIIYLGVKFRLK